MAKRKEDRINGDMTKEQEEALKKKLADTEKDLEKTEDALSSAMKKINSYKKNVDELSHSFDVVFADLEEANAKVLKHEAKLAKNGTLGAKEEKELKVELENAKKDLEQKIKDYNDLSAANVFINNKLHDTQDKVFKMIQEDNFEDANFKKMIQNLCDTIGKKDIENQEQKFKFEAKIEGLEKELRELKTPNFAGKVTAAVNALHNIDLRVGDFYDEIAYLTIIFNELLHSKSEYDVRDYKRISRKVLRKMSKRIRKMNIKIIRQFD